MEDDIKTINKIIEFYKQLDEMHGKEKCIERQALEHFIQANKEDKAVIYYMIEDIRKRSIDCVYSHEELEKIYRNKVKELGRLDE